MQDLFVPFLMNRHAMRVPKRGGRVGPDHGSRRRVGPDHGGRRRKMAQRGHLLQRPRSRVVVDDGDARRSRRRR